MVEFRMRNFLKSLFAKKAAGPCGASMTGYFNPVEDLTVHDDFNFPTKLPAKNLHHHATELTADMRKIGMAVKAAERLGPLSAHLYLDNYGLTLDGYTRGNTWEPSIRRTVHFRDLPDTLIEKFHLLRHSEEQVAAKLIGMLGHEGIAFVDAEKAGPVLARAFTLWHTEEILMHDSSHRVYKDLSAGERIHEPSPLEPHFHH
jgi:hypothetical protein